MFGQRRWSFLVWWRSNKIQSLSIFTLHAQLQPTAIDPVVWNQVLSPKPKLGPTQSPIQCLPGSLSPGRVAATSPPSSAEVENEWSYTAIPHAPSWHSQTQIYFHNFNTQTRCSSIPSLNHLFALGVLKRFAHPRAVHIACCCQLSHINSHHLPRAAQSPDAK
jgi:hypothetical protein